MHRTLKALIVSALTSGALLLIATLALDAWHWRLYQEAQTLQSASSGSDAVVVENPYGSLPTSMTTYLQLFVGCCAAATFWAVFVVIPSLLVSRRVFTGALAGGIVAAVVVCVVSGTVFALMQPVTPYISPLIPVGVGGAIGLLNIMVLARMLPRDRSLERTREG